MKTKKKPKNAKLSLLLWGEVAELPLQMFHTITGTIVGHVTKGVDGALRIYAPTVVTFVPPASVGFSPIAFVEHYLDLMRSGVRSTSPVPAIVRDNYPGYFARFIDGGYEMRPVLVSAGIEDPNPSTEEEKVEPPKNGHSHQDENGL